MSKEYVRQYDFETQGGDTIGYPIWDKDDAIDFAHTMKLRVIEKVFEYVGSSVVEDFTEQGASNDVDWERDTDERCEKCGKMTGKWRRQEWEGQQALIICKACAETL